MSKFIVDGGRALSGTVTPSGSKNAALPVIFSTLLTSGVSAIRGLPDILDVRCALDIIVSYGARVTRLGEVTYVDTRDVHYTVPSEALTGRLRASTYLIGSSLVRFGRAPIGSFGGCNFGFRPIDLHIYAAECLGARMEDGELVTSGLSGGEISFPIKSVGATANALIMASGIDGGETVIHGAASEEHIDTLSEYLTSAGALIEREGDSIRVIGSHLVGGRVTIPPDPIEAATYLSLCAMTGGRIGVIAPHSPSLSSFLDPLVDSGAGLLEVGGAIYLESPPDRPVVLTTMPHPGFPTDIGPICAPLLSMGAGGVIRETVWRSRFGYLSELRHFGVRSRLGDSYAEILPSSIIPANAKAPDLRGGAALLLMALTARGRSCIDSAETVLRGYESPTEKLRSLGADVTLID